MTRKAIALLVAIEVAALTFIASIVFIVWLVRLVDPD